MEPIEQNVGTADRLARAVIAIVILVFMILRGKVSPATALALLAGGMLLCSASSGVCTLYTELGISTVKEDGKKA
jgi:hypothetical protein